MAADCILKVKPHLLPADKVPGTDTDGAHAEIHRQIIAVASGVAVHRPDDALASANQETDRSVDVIRPSGDWLPPGRYHDRGAEDDHGDVLHCFNDHGFTQSFGVGVSVGAFAKDSARSKGRKLMIRIFK